MEEEMNGREAFYKLKKNIEWFERNKSDEPNFMRDLTFKYECVFPFFKIIDKNWNDLTPEEKAEFIQIQDKYYP